MKTKIFFTKLTQWEHWPSYMFYVPNLPYAFYKAFQLKSFTFFLHVNPAIKNSGDGTDSKYKTLLLAPRKNRPKSVLIPVATNLDEVIKQIANAQINFPLIAKPDRGFRGLLVEKINTQNQLKEYINKNTSLDIILQEFITLKKECGIFYYRLPNQEKGKITSITLKKFLTVIGDGVSSLSELILADTRAFFYMDLLKKIHGEKMFSIPIKGKKIILTVIGNHSKGTEFINGNHLITSNLEDSFDALSKQMNGFYFGRLDIKYDTLEKLIQGDFKILEINGILAEPTHIYDASFPKASYFKAVKAIQNNWRVIAKIAVQNKQNLELKPIKPINYIKQMFALRRYAKKLNSMK